jgi:hypothetical protein
VSFDKRRAHDKGKNKGKTRLKIKQRQREKAQRLAKEEGCLASKG